jgi:hypothetical protein
MTELPRQDTSMSHLPESFVQHLGGLPKIDIGHGAVVILRSGQRRVIGPRPEAEPDWDAAWFQTDTDEDIVAYCPFDTTVPDQIVLNADLLLSRERWAEAYRLQARKELERLIPLYREQWPFVRGYIDVERNPDTFDEDDGL